MRRQDRYLGPYAVSGSITPSVANCVGQRAAGGRDGTECVGAGRIR